MPLIGSGLIQSADTWPKASDWLIRDEFSDTVAAGSVNGTAATPGPETRAVVDASSKFSVASGVLSVAAGASDTGDYLRYAVTRATGLVALGRIATPITSGGRHHFAFGPESSFYGYQHISGGTLAISVGAGFNSSSFNVGTYDTTEEQIAIIARSTGYLFLRKISSNWQLDWVGVTDSTSALYARVSGTKAFTADSMRAIQLPAPFDTDTGLATDTHSGAVAAGATFTHESDFVLEFTVDTLPSAGGINIRFRKSGTSWWAVYIDSAGSISLLEVVNSSSTQRGVVAGVVSNGHRIVVIADDESIRVFSNNISRINYSSAASSKTNTNGENAGLGTGGAVSDLYTWPRTLGATAETTQAANIMDKVSA